MKKEMGWVVIDDPEAVVNGKEVLFLFGSDA